MLEDKGGGTLNLQMICLKKNDVINRIKKKSVYNTPSSKKLDSFSF